MRLATVEPGNMHDSKIFRQSRGSIIPTASIQSGDLGYVDNSPDNHRVDYNICFILSFLSFAGGSLLRGSLLEAQCLRLSDHLIEDLVLPLNNLILTDQLSIPSKNGSEGLGYSDKYLEFR